MCQMWLKRGQNHIRNKFGIFIIHSVCFFLSSPALLSLPLSLLFLIPSFLSPCLSFCPWLSLSPLTLSPSPFSLIPPFPFPLLSVFLSPYFSKCLAYPWNANSSVKIIWITYYITSLESTCHGWAWSFLLWFSHQFGDNINWPRHLEEEALHKIHGVKCYKIIGCWKYIWVEEMTMSFFLKVIWQWTFISVAKKSQSHKT